MSEIQIIVMEGNYANDDAYRYLLGYISQKAFLGGYGFCCKPGFTIIEQFKMSEKYSNFSSLRKMWHFVITFQTDWKDISLLNIAVQAAQLFAPEYQILFALDLKGTPHLHFGVNAFSYHPDSPILSKEIMDSYLKSIQERLSVQYPTMSVALLYKENPHRWS